MKVGLSDFQNSRPHVVKASKLFGLKIYFQTDHLRGGVFFFVSYGFVRLFAGLFLPLVQLGNVRETSQRQVGLDYDVVLRERDNQARKPSGRDHRRLLKAHLA